MQLLTSPQPRSKSSRSKDAAAASGLGSRALFAHTRTLPSVEGGSGQTCLITRRCDAALLAACLPTPAGVSRSVRAPLRRTLRGGERAEEGDSLFTAGRVRIQERRLASAREKLHSTVNVCRISHRKWRESKQQLIRLLDLTLPGCILVSFHILCDILQTFTVIICTKA